MTKIDDYQNVRRPKWKLTKIEDEIKTFSATLSQGVGKGKVRFGVLM